MMEPEGCKDIAHLWSLAVSLQDPDDASVVCSVVDIPQAK